MNYHLYISLLEMQTIVSHIFDYQSERECVPKEKVVLVCPLWGKRFLQFLNHVAWSVVEAEK